MLLTSAVVPGPPAFVPELMGAAAHELDDLREAADRAVSRVLADLVTASAGAQSGPGSQSSGSGAVQLVVVGSGEPAEFHAPGPVSFAGFGRDVVVPALVDGQPAGGELPTPIMVARYLASRDIAANPSHAPLWAAARWLTTHGADATALGQQLAVEGTVVGLILVADGAACHGPKAPRAEDARAGGYDESVCDALGSGELSRLADIDGVVGHELGATGVDVWPVLVAAATSSRVADRVTSAGIGEVLWAGAPYGVGWAVASWRRS
jgi:hypothetical protein